MIFDGQRERRAVYEVFDYVIIGSGAAGSCAARVLADTGASLAVVEEGPRVDTREFGDKVFPAFRKMFRNQGSLVARGKTVIPIVQGSCLGGSTVVNSAIMWRVPEDVWVAWRDEYGIGDAVPYDRLHEHWDLLEEELEIRPVDRAVWGGHNEAMHRASEVMGIDADPIRRADAGCRGSARCLTGCPHGAKQSMLVSYLPYASERGAVLFTSARVDRVMVKGGRAEEVRGHFHVPGLRKNIRPFRLRARKGVLVACSAIQTPGLLERSGVTSSHLGRHFQGHPGVPLAGLFEDPVDMWFGATQGYDAHHHRQDGRFKIETLSLPPELAFVRLPGVGAEWLRGIARSAHLAVWGAQVRAYAQGTVRDRFDGKVTDVTYTPEPRDIEIVRRALKFTAEMFFAAGAKEVMPLVYGMPESITSPDELRVFDEAPRDPAAYSYILSHLFGTARMAPAAHLGVVGTDFAVHGTDNLWVIDSSIFPTNLGVNPQHAIMAVAMEAAHRIAAQA